MTADEKDSRLRVIVIVGTRPEAIKLFPIIQRLKQSQLLVPFVVNTGQHRDLVEPVLEMAGIKADVDLGVGSEPRTLNGLVAAIVTGVEGVVEDLRAADPDQDIPFTAAVLVHGDTTSAMAGALASIQVRLPVIHVEAGLRTDDTLSPFPEELNRQLIARIACFHLAPTTENLGNLVQEHVPATRVFVTGNTGIDALQWAADMQTPFDDSRLETLVNSDHPVIVVTAHRRENWEGGLARIATAIAEIARARPEVRVVLPLHPNPRVRDAIRPILDGIENVLLTEPLEYANFARLLKRARIAITDSGGVQEEAPSLGTPVLVTRDQTERQEGVDAGTLKLVGTNTELIVSETLQLLDNPAVYEAMSARRNPYGDGFASARIVAALETIAFGETAPSPFGPSFSRSAVLLAAGYEDLPASPYEMRRQSEPFGSASGYVGPERRRMRRNE
ncbi:MAG: UDP-N-acetylglucosamine 2-epimerase (non-hydrolyzing) [Candidatus Nanopelagicales bacterium]